MRRLADLDEALKRYDARIVERDPHPIPPIEGLGTNYGWDQPERSRILVDATHAIMDRATFEELMEYSGTKPSGVYPGKMWRRHDGLFDARFMASGGRPVWMLCWYGLSEIGPGFCSNHHRLILLSDGDLPEAGA